MRQYVGLVAFYREEEGGKWRGEEGEFIGVGGVD
jgi:hypothetical protein